MRVLLADDERLLLETVADGLRTRSMAVGVCYDGDDAALERLGVKSTRWPSWTPTCRGAPTGRPSATA